MIIKPLNVLALMSGTSFDGIKYALVSTDGVDLYETFLTGFVPFDEHLCFKINLIAGKNINNPDDKILIDSVDNDVTLFMQNLIEEILQTAPCEIDLIGIEGPTIAHSFEEKYTYQLGKAGQIFEHFKKTCVSHFHNADILNGGQGNPIGATYFQALSSSLEKPVVFIHIGGITSLTNIGNLGEMTAFDCGPGNTMLNNFMKKHAGISMDYNGKMAALGKADDKIITGLMRHKFFKKMPPKSLEREIFQDKEEHLEGLSVQDGAATVTAFIAEAVVYSILNLLTTKPISAVLCGSGSRNPTLARLIRQKLNKENVLINTNVLTNDASAIAFLSARRYYCLPITFPSTTGVAAPLVGGKLYNKEN